MSNLIDNLPPNTSFSSSSVNNIDVIQNKKNNNKIYWNDYSFSRDDFKNLYCFENLKSPLANCTNNINNCDYIKRDITCNKKNVDINMRLAGIISNANSDENSIQYDLFDEEIIKNKRYCHRYNSQTSPIISKRKYKNIQTISTELTSISEIVTDEVFEEPITLSEKQLEELSLNDQKKIIKPMSYNIEKNMNMGVKRNFGSINSEEIKQNKNEPTKKVLYMQYLNDKISLKYVIVYIVV